MADFVRRAAVTSGPLILDRHPGNPNCTEDCNYTPPQPPPPEAIPEAQLPNYTKVTCAAAKYGSQTPKLPAMYDNQYAFYNPSTGKTVFSETSSSPPPDYGEVFGETFFDPQVWQGGWTSIYAGGLVAEQQGIDYIDPVTNLSGYMAGPFTKEEWALVTLVHEISHQNGLKGSQHDEGVADGLAVKALKAYRADHGAKCN